MGCALEGEGQADDESAGRNRQALARVLLDELREVLWHRFRSWLIKIRLSPAAVFKTSGRQRRKELSTNGIWRQSFLKNLSRHLICSFSSGFVQQHPDVRTLFETTVNGYADAADAADQIQG